MPTLLDLPYDVLQHLIAELSPVDVIHSISSSRKLYYPLIDDASTWRRFCTLYGIDSNTSLGGRSFRIIYGRLLHRYGPLIGLWCSDYPFTGNIVEFRLLPDHRFRDGEHIIVGDVWKLPAVAAQSGPRYPTYIEFIQIGFTPRSQSSPEIADDVHISWHQRSEQDLSAIDFDGLLQSWSQMDDEDDLGNPSLHVLAPTNLTLTLEPPRRPWTNPEFPQDTPAAWYDADRGVPRLRQEDPPPVDETQRHWWTNLHYVAGVPKPASISFFPSPLPHHLSNVRILDLHNPVHALSGPYSSIIPRYYPLRTIMQEGMDPASPEWRPETLVGLWLGDYGPHGTECLFLEHDAAAAQVRAWKVTGDVNVPRGVCTWHANLSAEAPSWEDQSGRRHRAYEGMGRIARHGFVNSSETPARVIMSGRDEIMVELHTSFFAKFIRYRTERGRTGEQRLATGRTGNSYVM